ncbi:MAG: hypothetical protein EBU80_10800, partial [Chitinophagia bacterium]|nr:hypothetical protein [Chitinophagia bacterium]
RAFSNIIINSSGTTTGGWSGTGTLVDPYVFTPNQDNAILLASDLVTKLNAGSVKVSSSRSGGTQGGALILNTSLSASNNNSAARNFTIDVNGNITLSYGITLTTSGTGYTSNTGWPSHSLSLVSATGDISVNAAINTQPQGYNVPSNPNYVGGRGGDVTITTPGKVYVTGAITTSGGAQTNTGYNGSTTYGGRGGDVNITGTSGVSISNNISSYPGTIQWWASNYGGQYSYYYGTPGNLTISTDYSSVTSGVNEGQSAGIFYVGSITKNGSGVFKLRDSRYGGYDDASQSYYKSNVTVSAGTLVLATNASIRDGADVVVSSGTTFDLGGFSETVGSIAGAGTIRSSVTGALTLTMSYTNATNTTFSGLIENGSATNIGLTKNGSAMLTLSSANTYTGAVLVNAGIIRVTNSTGLGTVAGGVTVASGATLQLQGGIDVGTEALGLSGGGVNNYGALESVSGVNRWQGVVTLNAASYIGSDADSLTVSGNIALQTFGLTVANFVGNGNMLLSGIISSTSTGGTLTKSGSNRVTLSGGNTYSGTTVLNSSSGTLVVMNASALGTTGAVTVNSGSTLNLQGGISIGTGKTLNLNGSGVSTSGALLNASGVNSWAGSIVLGSATIIESDADSLTLGAINMQTYDLTVGSNTGSGHTLISGVISGTNGSSVLRKSSLNRLTLSGANTYSQMTYIDAGFLILGADNVLPGTPIYFNGGTLDNGGRTDVLGQLNIPVSSSLVLRGSGVITFGSVGALLDYKRLTIFGWQGTYGLTSNAGPSTATGSRVKFASMLSSYQLDQIWFNDGSDNYYALELSDGTYEIIPGQDVLLYPRAFSNIIINSSGTTTGGWSGTGTLVDPYVFTPN